MLTVASCLPASQLVCSQASKTDVCMNLLDIRMHYKRFGQFVASKIMVLYCKGGQIMWNDASIQIQII